MYRNDYGKKREPEGRIHVLWLNTNSCGLWLNTNSCGLETPGQTRAFDEASERVMGAYRQSAEYAPTWDPVDRIAYRCEVEAALDRDETHLGGLNLYTDSLTFHSKP